MMMLPIIGCASFVGCLETHEGLHQLEKWKYYSILLLYYSSFPIYYPLAYNCIYTLMISTIIHYHLHHICKFKKNVHTSTRTMDTYCNERTEGIYTPVCFFLLRVVWISYNYTRDKR